MMLRVAASVSVFSRRVHPLFFVFIRVEALDQSLASLLADPARVSGRFGVRGSELAAVFWLFFFDRSAGIVSAVVVVHREGHFARGLFFFFAFGGGESVEPQERRLRYLESWGFFLHDQAAFLVGDALQAVQVFVVFHYSRFSIRTRT
jgi:hypothetical protein